MYVACLWIEPRRRLINWELPGYVGLVFEVVMQFRLERRDARIRVKYSNGEELAEVTPVAKF